MDRNNHQTGLSRADIVSGLNEVGLKPGHVALVHSAMRTFGHIEGGAQTVVDGLLEVLGPTGTLVAPTFTFAHEARPKPLIDPHRNPSEMGIISETVRCHPQACRSIAYRHSFAAIGPRAQVITGVNPSHSPFDLRSSFGVMLALSTQVLLLGVTYSSSTSHHFAEWVCGVPYRRAVGVTVEIRQDDGSTVERPMIDYQPKSEGGSYYGKRSPDFNRIGRMLEDQQRVGRTFVGNAAVRRFAMRDLLDLAQVEAAEDHNIFRTSEGRPNDSTPLEFGCVVLSPTLKDGAGRHHQVEWCVKDRTDLP